MIGLGELLGGFSGLKARMLLMAGVVVLSGMAWNGSREFLQTKSNPFVGDTGGGALSGNWTKGSPASQDLLYKGDKWGEGSVRIGLSFMVAMIMASLLRAAFKTALTIILLSGLMLWFLENRGYMQVWDQYYQTVQEGGTWLATRIDVMTQFLKEHLPSAGAALIGFGFGLRR